MSAPGGLSLQSASLPQVSADVAAKLSGSEPLVWPRWDSHSLRELLLSESKPTAHLRYHVNAIRHSGALYETHVRHMIASQVHLGWTPVQKARILAAALSVKGEKKLAKFLLKTDGIMTLAEVLRACQWLDSPRAIRQLKSKLAKLTLQKERNPASVRDATLNKLRSNLANLEVEQLNNDDEAFRTPARGKGRRYVPQTPGCVGLSGNKLLMIKKWAVAIPAPTLSYFLLAFPKEPWQLLADLVHFSPKDFQLPFFLACVFGAEAPEGTMVHLAATSTKENLAERLLAERGLCSCYSFFRTHFKEQRLEQQKLEESIAGVMAMGFSRKEALIAKQHFPYQQGANATEAMVEWIFEHANLIAASADPVAVQNAEANQDLTNASKAAFGRFAPLEDVLWYYEELECPEVETAVHERLVAGEQLNPASHRSAYGKLMERILLCRKKNVKFWRLLLPLADKRLQAMKEVKANIEQAVMTAMNTTQDGSASSSSAAAAPAAPAAAAAAAAAPAAEKPSDEKDLISMLANAAIAPSSTTVSALNALMSSSTGSKDGSKRDACKVAVFGDASGSMEVAIQCASSLGALLSAVLDAELSFFNSAAFKPPVQPRSADDTLRVIDATEARDNTSMASALYPYYAAKTKLDLIILVSDEGENAAYHNELFAGLFRKYKQEINPQVKLFLVSFLPNDPGVVGTIKERLNVLQLGEEATQVRFDISRPDTTKFDNLLATLSLELELIRQRKRELKELLVGQHGLPNVLLDIVTEY